MMKLIRITIACVASQMLFTMLGADALQLEEQIKEIDQFNAELSSSPLRKVDFNLAVRVSKLQRGSVSKLDRVSRLFSAVRATNDCELIDCNIKAVVSQRLIELIEANNGIVVSVSKKYGAIHAKVPLRAIEKLANDNDVHRIQRVLKSRTLKANTSEADVAHKASSARLSYNVSGRGIKVGVMSDSARYLSEVQARGDLPDVCVLAGYEGVKYDDYKRRVDTGEGTAMLEIVHDLAPDAELYFATGFGTLEEFAEAVDKLKEKGCQIIVDDVGKAADSTLQDGIIASAINDFSDTGGIYLSSAGNSGNVDFFRSVYPNNSFAGVWEGDFQFDHSNDGYDYHKFGDSLKNRIVVPSSLLLLQWSDPWDHSNNNYDLYIVDENMNVQAKSCDVQDGREGCCPFEGIDLEEWGLDLGSSDYYVVIVKKSNAAARYLRLDAWEGVLLQGTDGMTAGHCAAEKAITVAAAHTVTNRAFVSTDPMEGFSSDGPRKIFFSQDGSAVTANKFLSSGGTSRLKPEITGADGVVCLTPGFEHFTGTSAAAPHAAAIAALMLEANPDLKRDDVMEIFKKSTFSGPNATWNRTSGYGILDAEKCVQLAIENRSGQVAAPANVMASDGKYDDGVRIEWTASEGATSYNLYRSEDATRPKTLYKTNVTSPYPDTDTDPGVDYYYWVEAVKEGSDKAVSASDAGWRKPTITRSWMAETQRFSWKGGSTNVAITANTAWTASCKKDWVTITSQGGPMLAYRVGQNTEGAEREDTITLTAAGNTPHAVTTTITVKQSPRGRPENDDFEHAEVLMGVSGVTSGDTTMATRQNGEPDIRPDDGPTSIWPLSHDPTTNTIWWVWTAPKDGITTFDLSDSDIAVAFEVYASAELPGSEDSPLVTVCDGETASATVSVTEGVTYSIRVGGYENAEGSVVLKWSLAESGNVWYVNATTGNNANPGKSENSAKKTIQAAIDAAVGYDTILVAPGTYQRISVSNTKPGIVIKSTGGFAVTTIDGQSSGTCASFGDRTIRLEGFTLCNGAGALSDADGVNGGTVVHSVIRDNSAGFSNTAGGAANSTLINCQLSNNVGVQAGGAYECTLSNCTVVGNVCTGNSNLSGGVFGCSAFNSIVWGNTDGNGTTNNYVFYAASFSHCCSWPAGSFVGGGAPSVTDDPQLIVSNGIYVLAATSPCIDAGDTLVVSTPLDLVGNARVVGAAVDMGAVEYQTARLKSPSPTEFKAVATSTSCVTLSWEYEHANATFYLYRSVPFLGGESLIATITGDTSYEDHGVESGNEYTYWIVAQRTDGDYAKSDRVEVTIHYFDPIDPTPIDTYTVIYYPGEYGVEPKKTFNEINSFHRVQDALFTRPNYTQTAWTTEDGKTTYNFGDLIVLSPGVTKLYPVWTENDGNQPVAVFDAAAKTLTFYCDGLDHAGPNRTIYTVGDTAIDAEPPWCTENCQETVTRVVIDGSFADYRPKHCSYWFYAFVNVLAIDGLEYLDVSQATSLRWMFTRCSKLTVLDLSGFDTRNVTNMRNMFTVCESLVAIYASESFVVDKVNDSQYMFNLCASLVGGNGTTYDEDNVDCTCARIDKSGTPGYFTKKTGDPAVVKIDKPTAVSGLTYTGTQQCGVTYDSRLTVSGDASATDADEYLATFTPANGATFDTDSCTVTITCETEGATIYYSTNGSTPRLKDQFKYTQPFTVTETTTIKAVAVKDGFTQSEIATAVLTKVDLPPLTLASALDEPKLSAVNTDGDAEWEPVKDVTAVGGSSARSGVIGMLQSTCLRVTVSGKGTLSFNWKVSCEADYSGEYTYDHMTFSTVESGRTNNIAMIDGETEWLPESVTFTTDGPHVILWTYSTDDWEEPGFEDCGWVDNVVWTGDAPPSDIVISDIVTLPKAEVEAFMAKYPSLAAQVGGDAEAFAKLPSATGKLDANGNQMYVWQDIIAGTDPTNPDDKFKIVDIMFEDGELKVTWSPDLNENGTKSVRAYTEYGRKELGGSEKWTDMKSVDPVEKSDYKFRKVTVDMP